MRYFLTSVVVWLVAGQLGSIVSSIGIANGWFADGSDAMALVLVGTFFISGGLMQFGLWKRRENLRKKKEGSWPSVSYKSSFYHDDGVTPRR